MIDQHPIVSYRRNPVTLKRDERSSVALWNGVVIAVWGECVDDDGLLAIWQACQASSCAGINRVQVMNVFEPGARTQVTEDTRRRLLKVLTSRSTFRVVQEANIFESTHEVPDGISRATPILGSNVDCSRWFDDVEYAGAWLHDELKRFNSISLGKHTRENRFRAEVDYCADDLLEVVGEIRGETTGIRLRLSALGLKA